MGVPLWNNHFLYIIYKGALNMAFEKLAEVIFPNVEHDREYYIAKYQKRNLKEGARVTRYAP